MGASYVSRRFPMFHAKNRRTFAPFTMLDFMKPCKKYHKSSFTVSFMPVSHQNGLLLSQPTLPCEVDLWAYDRCLHESRACLHEVRSEDSCFWKRMCSPSICDTPLDTERSFSLVVAEVSFIDFLHIAGIYLEGWCILACRLLTLFILEFPEGPILGTCHHQFERDHVFVRSNRSAVVTGYRNQFFLICLIDIGTKNRHSTTVTVTNIKRTKRTLLRPEAGLAGCESRCPLCTSADSGWTPWTTARNAQVILARRTPCA
jgi:hypothetical protein